MSADLSWSVPRVRGTWLAGAALSAALIVVSGYSARAQESSSADDLRELAPLTVEGVRPTEAGPLPGLTVTQDQIPGNIQSINKQQIQESHALSLGDFMNSQLQSVNVNDYAGNPFQVDITYRGFTASPQLGTPQGLSVFFDGIRVNEPFGDVVNWDLIPMNAIDRMDVFPGSNPLFGLNTLGGAISLRTKSGFTARGADAQLLGGSWGRKQLQLSAGGNNGKLGGFAALTYFDEDGWRDNSPSTVQQIFGRVDWRGERGTLGASVLAAGNDLIGNGLIPIELWRQRPETVFTSPDQTKNDLAQFSLFGALDVSETFNLSAQIYRRDSERRGYNGDIYEAFEDFESDIDYVRGDAIPHNSPRPLCQYLDADRDGLRDFRIIEDPESPGSFDFVNVPPLNDPLELGLCDGQRIAFRRLGGRNGAANGGPGVVEGTPIGLISKTQIDQLTDGAALQANWNLKKHKFMLGASIDASAAEYGMGQRLALIDASRNVYEAPDAIDPLYRAAQVDIRANDFEGTTRTRSAYFSETWSPRENLHLTFAGRYNHTKVKTLLKTRSAIGSEAGDLHNLRNRNVLSQFLLCPSEDPASCPAQPEIAPRDFSSLPVTPTAEEANYNSFNPAFGINWLPKPELNVFANLSQGTRTPSVVELGCAFDSTLIDLNAGQTDDLTGEPLTPFLRPRSLVGPTCTLPTTLSGDPFLPQIEARSAELGVRGKLLKKWDWNASLYRTDLKDDIYFVGVSAERSFFDTVGKTRRQGIELGLSGPVGRASLKINYSLSDATFQSRFYVLSPHNSSADFNQNSQPGSSIPTPTALDNGTAGTYRMTRVDPGARMPGIPLHNLNINLNYPVTERWSVGLNMVAHSKSFVRGNENNAHQGSGTDAETGIYLGAPGDINQSPGTPGRAFRERGYVPGYAIFNLQTTLKLSRGLTLFAQVNNLFDKEYFTAGRLGFTPFAPSTNGAIGPSGWNYNSNEWQNTTFVGPGAPRAFWLGLSYQLGVNPSLAAD